MLDTFYQGDCLKKLKRVATGSVAMIYTDLPFGTTNNRWDVVIPFEPLWEEFKRVIAPNRAIVLHAVEPFTSLLITSNLKWFRYRWTWNKVNRVTGFLDAKRRPLRVVEDVVVFASKSAPTPYHPQMLRGKPYISVSGSNTKNYAKQNNVRTQTMNFTGDRFPLDLLELPADVRGTEGRGHPTQKPVRCAEYFIKTYTDEGETVLDATMGSGTSGVACARLNRAYIGIENDPEMFERAKTRVEAARKSGMVVPLSKPSRGGFFDKR